MPQPASPVLLYLKDGPGDREMTGPRLAILADTTTPRSRRQDSHTKPTIETTVKITIEITTQPVDQIPGDTSPDRHCPDTSLVLVCLWPTHCYEVSHEQHRQTADRWHRQPATARFPACRYRDTPDHRHRQSGRGLPRGRTRPVSNPQHALSGTTQRWFQRQSARPAPWRAGIRSRPVGPASVCHPRHRGLPPGRRRYGPAFGVLAAQ